MTWSDFYLICFLVGLLLSVVSFLLGNLDLSGFHFHDLNPHFGDGHGADFGHAHADLGHAADAGDHVAAHGAHGVHHFSYFNFGTITAFLAWFGGTGYLLTRYSSFWFWTALFISAAVGVTGSLIVFWFVGKVLMAQEEDLNPADYDMIGVLGHVSSSIRAGGTGEIIYSQEGTRHTVGARSEDGSAIEKGAEVVVTRYERGIAYVRRWEELANEQSAAEGSETK